MDAAKRDLALDNMDLMWLAAREIRETPRRPRRRMQPVVRVIHGTPITFARE
jgi:hypothetical protein